MEQANLARLKNCMRRGMRGEQLKIGFFGGSITQGSSASSAENTYAYRVFCWWQETFPDAECHYINGGIGGTTSHYGAARVVSDMLMYQPDFVVVDFSVNDKADFFFRETYEGLIRKMITWPSKPAVLLLNNVYYDTGLNAQEHHNTVAGWYGIPYVSIRDSVYRRMASGAYTREELTQDGLHPNDRGHELVAAEIISFLETVKEHMWEDEPEAELPQPLTANAYEQAQCLTIRNSCPELCGFSADPREKKGHLDFFRNGWSGRRKGNRIVFRVEASCIAVQYRKTLKQPAACARLILDGQEEQAVTLDGNFEESWGECLYLEPVLHHGRRMPHTIEIEITEGDETMTPFYLLSLIVA